MQSERFRVAQRTFAPELGSVTHARRFVMSAIDGLDVNEVNVALLTTELAANAVLHAQTEFSVRVVPQGSVVRVEVANHALEMLPSLQEPHDEGGRGLRILDALARRWGFDTGPETKVVWFEVPLGAE